MKQNIYYKGIIYIDCDQAVPEMPVNRAYNDILNQFEKLYLYKLTSYPYTGTNLKDGQVVVEGIDYELQFDYTENPARIIAIPKEQPVNSIISGGEEKCTYPKCDCIEKSGSIKGAECLKEEIQDELWYEVVKICYSPNYIISKDRNTITIQKRKQ